MTVKPYELVMRAYLDDQLIEEGPVYSLASIVLHAMSESGIAVGKFLITEVDEP